MATKTETTKKTASKAKKTASTKATEASSQVEDVTAKAQERYFSVLEQGQTAALEGLETIVETFNRVSGRINERVDLPNIPALDTLPARMPRINIPEDLPTQLVDGYFEFANRALANQREFANKALAIASKN